MSNSYSGAHPFRPQCALRSIAEAFPDIEGAGQSFAADVTAKIDSGICPRCSGPLPTGNIFPAGSRLTRCRCIPICDRCGSDEVYELVSRTGRLSGVWQWPVGKSAITRRRNKFKAQCTPASIVADGHGGGVVLDDEGVTQIKLRPNPGGWLEFGYDDTSDQDEVGK